MRVLCGIAGLAAIASSVLMIHSTPAGAAACGQSYRGETNTRCVRVKVSSLAVVTAPKGRSVICHYAKGRKFWTAPGAGSKDRIAWYSVLLDSGVGYFSEVRYSKKRRYTTIERSKGCKS